MKIISTNQGKNFALKTKEISIDKFPNINNKISIEILNLLKNKEMYSKQIAKQLKIHEQKIYYYIRPLEKAGIIYVSKTEKINGTTAKFYSLSSDSFYFKVNEFKESSKVEEREPEFLKPFIENGELNALIIVGSPDPHGPQKARSRDGYFGMDLALFIGTFLNYVSESRVRLDTEVRDEELKNNNLIVIGGPIVNKITEQVNKKMPIYFDETKKGYYSTSSGKTYFDESTGVINKTKNPFNKDKEILLITGLRNSGTKSAILAFLKKFDELSKGNLFDEKIHSKVVEGEDLNSDGIVDNVQILE